MNLVIFSIQYNLVKVNKIILIIKFKKMFLLLY